MNIIIIINKEYFNDFWENLYWMSFYFKKVSKLNY